MLLKTILFQAFDNSRSSIYAAGVFSVSLTHFHCSKNTSLSSSSQDEFLNALIFDVFHIYSGPIEVIKLLEYISCVSSFVHQSKNCQASFFLLELVNIIPLVDAPSNERLTTPSSPLIPGIPEIFQRPAISGAACNNLIYIPKSPIPIGISPYLKLL